MNDNAIFETILKDEIIMGVMGILECKYHCYTVTSTVIYRKANYFLSSNQMIQISQN